MNTKADISPAPKAYRILLVDDHPLTLQGMHQLLDQEAGLMVCGEASEAHQALPLVQTLRPDLILCDISLPSKSGLEFIKDLKTLHPEVAVLVMSMHDENIFGPRVLRAGARGYIMKSEDAETVVSAIRKVLDGEIFVSPELSRNLLHDLLDNNLARQHDLLRELTDREFEVFQLIGQGISSSDIGRRLCISVKTVETHRIHLKQKLKLNTSTELTSHAVRWAAANQLA